MFQRQLFSCGTAPARHWAQATRVGVMAMVLTALVGGALQLSAQVPASEIQGRKIVMITGSTDGLGRATALNVGSTGAHVIVHGRNIERGQEVVDSIRATGGTARFYQADLGSLAQVRELAAAILRDYDRLDVLVNNAGIGRGQDGAGREVSADGYELRFAVNYLSHFYLTRTLLPLLKASAPARIVSVSSSGQNPIDFDDVMLERVEYQGTRAYGQSKLSQIMMTIDLNEELQGTGVTTYALHPGGYLDTSMVRERGGTADVSAEEGALSVVNLIMSPDVQSGQFYNVMEVGRPNAQSQDPEVRRRLRELSMQLVGLN